MVYNTLSDKNRGACVCRLRGSHQTSTLQPDADNAAVGSHDTRIFYRRHPQRRPPVFILQLKMQGSLLQQAERKEKPSTLIPDVDNAAVGNDFALFAGGYHLGFPPAFFIPYRKEKRIEGERPGSCIAAMGSRVPA